MEPIAHLRDKLPGPEQGIVPVPHQAKETGAMFLVRPYSHCLSCQSPTPEVAPFFHVPETKSLCGSDLGQCRGTTEAEAYI